MSDLPYTDTKPQGAADFYYAINATFRHIQARFGMDGWRRYLQDLGREYFAPVNAQWRRDGLDGVAKYWRAFFAAEPGAEVTVARTTEGVEIAVHVCPAIKHLRAGGRAIVETYCQHCYHLGEARAREAGLTMRLQGGNGACVHRYAPAEAPLPAQDPAAIARVDP